LRHAKVGNSQTTHEFSDHVGHNYTNGTDIRQAILKIHSQPPYGADTEAVWMWEKVLNKRKFLKQT